MDRSYSDSNGNVTPTGGIPGGDSMMLMSGSGAMPGNAMSISSGTGDIVLDNGGGGKSKKWLVIGGIVLLVVVIVVLAVFALNPNLLSGGNGASAKTVEEKFNTYANYFLYGKSDDISEIEYNENQEETFFATTIYGDDAWNEYALKLMNYYNVFYDSFVVDNSNNGLLEKYKTELKLVLAYRSGASIDLNGLLNAYKDGGSNYAENWIEEKIEPYLELDTISGLSYYDEMLSWGKGNLEYVELIDRNGCIDNGKIVYQCISDSVSMEGEAIMRGVSDHYWKIQSVLKNCENDLFSLLFTIKDYVYLDGIDGDDNENE